MQTTDREDILSERSFTISFTDCDLSEANILTNELEDALIEAAPGIKIERRRLSSSSQDFGATLAVVLGAPATMIIAKAIANMMRKNSGARIKICADGSVTAEHLDSPDAARIAEAFSKAFPARP
jgi:hypothetical protein